MSKRAINIYASDVLQQFPELLNSYDEIIEAPLFGKIIKRKVVIAFPHPDGKGYNIFLDSLPLDGKLTLRPLKLPSWVSDPDSLWPPHGVGTNIKEARALRRAKTKAGTKL